jgi:hypothetical protein
VAAVAGGAEDAAAVVAAPVVGAVGAAEDVAAGAAVHGLAGAGVVGVFLYLAGEELGEERGQVDGDAWFLGGGTVGIVLGRQAEEAAAQLAELPFDVDLVGVEVVALQADDLAPAQAGVGDGDEHGELLVAA